MFAGVGATLGAVFAGGHVGAIKASRTGYERGSTAAISATMAATATLSGRRRRSSRSDRQRSKGRNDENLSHDRSPSQCVIARQVAISGSKRDPISTGETGERSFSVAPPPPGGAQAGNEQKQYGRLLQTVDLHAQRKARGA